MSALSLAALVFSAVILASPHDGVHLGWLPWLGTAPGAWVAVFAVAGLVAVFLAITGRARFVLMLFTLATLIFATRGLFFSSWKFAGMSSAENGLHFVLALFMAFLGSIPTSKRDRYRR